MYFLENDEELRINSEQFGVVKSLNKVENLKKEDVKIIKIDGVKFEAEMLYEYTGVIELEIKNSFIVGQVDFMRFLEISSIQLINVKYTAPLNFEGALEIDELYLDASGFGYLNGLNCVSRVSKLHLVKCGIVDCSILEKFVDIKLLNLSDNPLELSTIPEKFKSLEILVLNNCGLNSIRTFSDYVNLKELFTINNKIKSIEKLDPNLPLEYINLDNNKIESIESLKSFKLLKSIHANRNEISDLSVLNELKLLEEIQFARNPIQKDSIPLNYRSIAYI